MSFSYIIGDKLGEGRFTEIFSGMAISEQGFKGRVRFKRASEGWMSHPSFPDAFRAAGVRTTCLQHANIVRTYDVGLADGVACLIMGGVDGVSLGHLLRSMGDERVLAPVAVYIASECCKGLHYAHCLDDPETGEPLGITHGELSPANILLSNNGEVLLADFGFAQTINNMPDARDPEMQPVMWLDPRYQSPDWVRGDGVTPRSDVFSMGMALWHMLTGRRVFDGDGDMTAAVRLIKEGVPAPSSVNAEVDPDLDAVVLRALEREPATRYQSAADLGDALTQYSSGRQLEVTARDVSGLVRAHSRDPLGPGPGEVEFVSDLRDV